MYFRLHREPRDRRSTCTRWHFSWLRSGTSFKNGFDYSWSQCPQRRKWIKAQSSILDRGTRFSYSMDSVVPVQNKAENLLHWQFVGIWQILWRSIMEYHRTSTPHRSETNGIAERAVIWLGWKMVGWFCGMLLLSAKCSRSLGKWENALESFVHRNQRLFLSVYVEDDSMPVRMTLRWLERSRIWLPCGRNWWNLLILTNQHHFLIMFFLGCTQRDRMGETSRKNCRVVLRHGRTREKAKVRSQIVSKCLYLARIGRPDILRSVNKLARAVTKWTRACDRRLARLISYIHHTNDCGQYCHVGNTAQHCRLGLFQDSDFAGDLEDSKSTWGEILCVFGSRTFVPISWMCKKQTSVSHSSTESQIISLDGGLRMDGIHFLDLWNMVIEVLHSSNNVPPTQKYLYTENQTKRSPGKLLEQCS